MSAIVAVKDGIIALLEADPAIDALVAHIFNGRIPDGVVNVSYPYIIVGDTNETDPRITLKRSDENILDIKVWGLQKGGGEWLGRRQVDTVLVAIVDAIQGAKLNLGPHEQALLRRVLAFTMADPDPNLVQGIVRVRVVSR